MANPIAHPKPGLNEETRAFWEGCARHELVLQRCRRCDTVQHRPRALCASCLSDDIEHFVSVGRGSIYTYTVTHQNQASGFREAVPYVLAYVELDAGVRMLTNIVDCPPEKLEIGLPVEVDWSDGEGFTVPRFRPA